MKGELDVFEWRGWLVVARGWEGVGEREKKRRGGN